MSKQFLFLVTVFFIIILAACQNQEKKTQVLDTPTSGEITISADESLHPLIEAEVLTFQGIYPGSKINVNYLPESDAINQLLTDSARVTVITRPLTAKEASFIKDQKLDIYTVKFAEDAIALIVNKDNPDTLLQYNQLLGIIRGEIKSWNELSPQASASEVNVVFDNNNSGTVRLMKDSLARVTNLPSNCFALNSNPKVIDYVSTHKGALGLIGVSWVSDRDDSLSRSFLNKIKVIALSSNKLNPEKTDSTANSSTEYYFPFQAEIKLRQYPLYRDVYVISRENRSGLGSGFTSFLASDAGQRIVQKAGLLPVTMPTRIINLGDDTRLKQQMQEE